MNKFIVKIFFSLVISLPLLVFPSTVEVIAQASSLTGLCLDIDNGGLAYPRDQRAGSLREDDRCTSPYKFAPVDGLKTDFKYVCTFQEVSDSKYNVAKAGVSNDGKYYDCQSVIDLDDSEGGNFLKNIDLVPRSAVAGAPVITPPINPSPTPGPNPGPSPTPSPTTKPPVITQGDQTCDSGFVKVGPLCVPESPITNKDSIANSGSIGDLATRIIRVLLFFSAIVAVIFVIIGGYQVMTAQGNETQALNGRKTLTNALIGLVIIIMSYAIVQAVVVFIIK